MCNGGKVRVLEYGEGGWVQLGGTIDGVAYNEQAGYSLSLSSDGSRVAIGSPGQDYGSSAPGRVRVLEYTGVAWEPVGETLGGGWGDSGMGPARSTSIVSVAAGLHHSLAVDDTGRVFSWGSNEFGQLGAARRGLARGLRR